MPAVVSRPAATDEEKDALPMSQNGPQGWAGANAAGGPASLVRFGDQRRHRQRATFNRAELSQLLAVYSQRVAQGEWRDYAIDHMEGVAVFSIFRHTHETPLFSVAKYPGRGNRQTDYAVFAGRQRLKRATSLAEVLGVFERKLSVVRD